MTKEKKHVHKSNKSKFHSQGNEEQMKTTKRLLPFSSEHSSP